jgi:hypothetical protein
VLAAATVAAAIGLRVELVDLGIKRLDAVGPGQSAEAWGDAGVRGRTSVFYRGIGPESILCCCQNCCRWLPVGDE